MPKLAHTSTTQIVANRQVGENLADHLDRKAIVQVHFGTADSFR